LARSCSSDHLVPVFFFKFPHSPARLWKGTARRFSFIKNLLPWLILRPPFRRTPSLLFLFGFPKAETTACPNFPKPHSVDPLFSGFFRLSLKPSIVLYLRWILFPKTGPNSSQVVSPHFFRCSVFKFSCFSLLPPNFLFSSSTKDS